MRRLSMGQSAVGLDTGRPSCSTGVGPTCRATSTGGRPRRETERMSWQRWVAAAALPTAALRASSAMRPSASSGAMPRSARTRAPSGRRAASSEAPWACASARRATAASGAARPTPSAPAASFAPEPPAVSASSGATSPRAATRASRARSAASSSGAVSASAWVSVRTAGRPPSARPTRSAARASCATPRSGVPRHGGGRRHVLRGPDVRRRRRRARHKRQRRRRGFVERRGRRQPDGRRRRRDDARRERRRRRDAVGSRGLGRRRATAGDPGRRWLLVLVGRPGIGRRGQRRVSPRADGARRSPEESLEQVTRG